MTRRPADILAGDRVEIFLDSKFWDGEGWFKGTVVQIEPYSTHRSFIWVRLDDDAQAAMGGRLGLISVLNPKNIRKAD